MQDTSFGCGGWTKKSKLAVEEVAAMVGSTVEDGFGGFDKIAMSTLSTPKIGAMEASISVPKMMAMKNKNHSKDI